MSDLLHRIMAAAIAVALGLGAFSVLPGCEDDDLGDKIEDVGDDLEEAGKDLGREIEDIAD